MRRIILVMSAVALMAVMMVAMAAPAMAKKKTSAPSGHTTALTTQSTNPTIMDTNGSMQLLEDCYDLAEIRGTNPEDCKVEFDEYGE